MLVSDRWDVRDSERRSGASAELSRAAAGERKLSRGLPLSLFDSGMLKVE